MRLLHRAPDHDLGNAVAPGIPGDLLHDVLAVEGDHIGPELFGQSDIGLHFFGYFRVLLFDLGCFHQNRREVAAERPSHAGGGADHPGVGGGRGQADQHVLPGVIVLARRLPLPDHLPVHPVRGPAKRDLPQRGEIFYCKEVRRRPPGLLLPVNLPLLQALLQLLRGNVHQLHLVRLVEYAVRNALAHPDMGDRGHDVVKALQMLHVHRGVNVDPRFQ